MDANQIMCVYASLDRWQIRMPSSSLFVGQMKINQMKSTTQDFNLTSEKNILKF